MKKNLVLAAVLAFALMFYSTSALSIDPSAPMETLFEKYFGKNGKLSKDGKALVDELNNYSDRVPDYAKALLGDERMEVRLKLSNGEEKTVTVETKKGEIKNMELGNQKGTTIIVLVGEATARQIATAASPMQELNKALKDKRITLKPVGFVSSIKTTIITTAMNIGNFFGKITGKIILFTRFG